MKNEKNLTFIYLYALLIIMVIDDHVSMRIGILSSIFPYNSFYMPLFVFSSGYFFKKKPFWNNILYKVKKLFIPYIIFCIIFNIIAFVIDHFLGTYWYGKITFKVIMRTIFLDSPTTLNGASWFVIMLFWVQIIYNTLRIIVKQTKLHDYFLTIVLTFLGLVAVNLCIKGFYKNDIYLFFLRTIFYMQFYNLGYFFKEHIEKHILNSNKYIICLICIAINILLIIKFNHKINFFSTAWMSGFNKCYLPLITSCTGIIFYYLVMEFLSRKIGEIRLIDFISRNTFIIMQIHLIFLNIPNMYVYYQICHGSPKYSDFNVAEFLKWPWYRYSPNSCLVGFVLGITGSFIIAYCIEYIKFNKTNILNGIKKIACK